MIPFNLKNRGGVDHPLNGKYGVIVEKSSYFNYPITIVDNHRETLENGCTGERALCLLHLAEDVRQYIRLLLHAQYRYLDFHHSHTYRIFPYEKEDLSKEQVIKILKRVLYIHQPSLQDHTLVSTSSDRLEDDPNYYEGQYVLNDEEEYTILKRHTDYKLFKGNKSYLNWRDEDGLLYESEIDFEIYKTALETERLRSLINMKSNGIVNNGNDDTIVKYRELKKTLDHLVRERLQR